MNKLINNLRQLNINNNLLNKKKYLENYNSLDYKKFINLKNNTYNRNLVYRDKNFELFIISWNKNNYSGIHNHSENGCLFKILEGEIVETRYNIKNLEEGVMIKYNTYSEVSYIDNSLYYHKMENIFDIPCISLHIYSPPKFEPVFY
tara:strand:+ start:56 stop:496 length:441 start_codon:yes stop_codon:yes gene_type:complete